MLIFDHTFFTIKCILEKGVELEVKIEHRVHLWNKVELPIKGSKISGIAL